MTTVNQQQTSYFSQLLSSTTYQSLKAGVVYGGIAYCTGGAPFTAAAIGTVGTAVKQCLGSYFDEPTQSTRSDSLGLKESGNITGEQFSTSKGNGSQADRSSISSKRSLAKYSVGLICDSLMLSTSSVFNAAASGATITSESLFSYISSAATGVFAGKVASQGTKELMSRLGFADESALSQLATAASEIIASGCAAKITQLAISSVFSSITEQMSALSNDKAFITELSNATQVPADELYSRFNDTETINKTVEVLQSYSEQQLHRAVRDLGQGAGSNGSNGTTNNTVTAAAGGGTAAGVFIVGLCAVCFYCLNGCSDSSSSSSSSSSLSSNHSDTNYGSMSKDDGYTHEKKPEEQWLYSPSERNLNSTSSDED